MRIAALGDIHGNYAALKAALHRIESENARVTSATAPSRARRSI